MKPKEECGVFGGFAFEKNIAPFIKQGLFHLQHRGQESAGICAGEKTLYLQKGSGLVDEVLTNQNVYSLDGRFGIGHVRYSTQGDSDALHAQPFLVNYLKESVAVAHNGNVSKAIQMRDKYEKFGEIFLTNSDTEAMLKRVVFALKKQPSLWTFDEVAQVLSDNFTGGAWSIVFQLPERILAFKDPNGFRPLMFCEAEEGYFVASEDCAFNNLHVKKIIEINAGEGIEITKKDYEIKSYNCCVNEQKCVFEHIYFSKAVSNVFGKNVYLSRIDMGRMLAKENYIDADIVVPIMDSGLPAALGYSHESKIPLHMGLIRNHFVGRSFISPYHQDRISYVREKLSPVSEILKGKRIILVDDSIVRGTTSKEIVKMVRDAGASQIHFRVASPMVVNTCSWGVDISSQDELLSNISGSEADLAEYLGAESLKYLSFEGLQQLFGNSSWCYNCFTKNKKDTGCTTTKVQALI